MTSANYQECDEEDWYDELDDLDCLWCVGEGWVEGNESGWDDGDCVRCPSCGGSGLRKDMTLW
jgi:DnaJ-class molecular chaperone